MNVALRTPRMSREQFLDWVERQEAPYEFDAFEPVAMNGSSVNHSLICHNIYFALRTRLTGTGCRVLGPNVGIATLGNAVRYSDALVSCTDLAGPERLVPGVVVVFEVVSPSSVRNDRVTKLREYAAVASIRRYVILEDGSADLTVFTRHDKRGWVAAGLAAGETLPLPEIGVEIPVDELYVDVRLRDQTDPR